MMFVALNGYQSIRETIIGLLANAHKPGHLGLNYVVRRSTFSDANKRRPSEVNLPKGLIITFDKAYVDYARYDVLPIGMIQTNSYLNSRLITWNCLQKR